MDLNLEIIVSIELIIIVFAIYAIISKNSKIKHYEDKYSGITDIQKEIQKSTELKNKTDLQIIELQKKYKEKSLVFDEIVKIEDLESSYKFKKSIFDKLVKEAAIYDETIQLAELGFYKPHFDYDTSEKYKEEIIQSKKLQKEMVSNKTAIYCTTEWRLNGSKAKGKTLTNR